MVVTKRKTVQDYMISFEFWNKIKPLLPLPKPKKKPGRPRGNEWKILSGIFYVLRTGCHWKELPRFYGAPGTVHDRFQEWREDGLFGRMWQSGCRITIMKKGLSERSKQLSFDKSTIGWNWNRR